jgi:hypothetical protein
VSAASAAAWALVVGMLAVSGGLLWVSARIHQRTRSTRRVFRSATVGYLLGLVVVTGLLVAGPLHWPPSSALRLWTVALALPVFSGVGALLGWARHGRGRAGGHR